jgi:hypothetical protein
VRVWLEKYWLYLVVTLAILAPLFAPGYVLTMDMVFVPRPPLPTEVNASYPFYGLLHYLSVIVPGDVLQKLVLTGIFLLMGIGMHRLLRQQFGVGVSHWAIRSGALLYMVNPFVYERLMMGQFAVLGGYALLPFFIHSLVEFLDTLQWKQLRRVVAWVVAISIISIHTLVPVGVVALLLGAQTLWRRRRREGYAVSLFRRSSVGVVMVLAVSSYWLIPLFLGSGMAAAALNGSSASAGFATQGGVFAILRLQGFWAEYRDLFIPVQQVTFLPIVGQVVLWAIMILGAKVLWKRKRSTAAVYLGMIVVACIVAFGVVGFSAYREPHKIVVLVAIGLAVFLCAGVQRLQKGIRFTQTVGIVACALPLLLTPVLLWGGWNQLAPRDYPDEWYTMNRRLAQIDTNEAVVFVPWHLYQRFSFSPRITAHPAAPFFDAHPVLVSNDPEFSGVQPLQNDIRKRSIGELLVSQPDDIAPRLRELGVGYILLAREPGYEDIEFIRSRPDVHRIFVTGTLELYKVGAKL